MRGVPVDDLPVDRSGGKHRPTRLSHLVQVVNTSVFTAMPNYRLRMNVLQKTETRVHEYSTVEFSGELTDR